MTPCTARRSGRRALGVFAISVALVAPAAAWDADPPADAPRRAPDLDARVAKAREAGVRWLRGQLGEDGAYKPTGSNHSCPAETAFLVFVLRSAGVPRNDPDLVRALKRVREDFGERRRRNELIGHETYGWASLLLALERLAADVPGDPPQAAGLGEADRALAAACREKLADVQVGDGAFSYGIRGSSWHDHSNTHWALLGLHAAARLGLKTDNVVWKKAAEHLLWAQEKRGPKVPRYVAVGNARDGYALQADGTTDEARGWSYLDNGRTSGSMTAAGVMSVALCREALVAAGDLDRPLDRQTGKSIRDGLAWLDANFTVEGNPGYIPPELPPELAGVLAAGKLDLSLSGFHYDFLAALERSCSFLRLEWVGKHDAFAEAATYLTNHQAADGHWNLTPFDTCFAVLTLSRSPWRIDERAWK